MSRKQDATDEMAWQDLILRENGLLDPDQPTEWAHVQHRERMRSDFTSTERALIRDALGL